MNDVIRKTADWCDEMKKAQGRIYFDGKKKGSFPVKCSNGFYADAATSRRLTRIREGNVVYYEYATDTDYVKYIQCETEKPVFARVFEIENGALTIKVYKASLMCRGVGLDWKLYYKGRAGLSKGDIEEEGAGSIGFWVTRESCRPLYDQFTDLYLETASKLSPEEYLLHVWNIQPNLLRLVRKNSSGAQGLLKQCRSMKEILRLWEKDTLQTAVDEIKARDFRKQKFGVEIEFTGIPRATAASVLAYFFHAEPVHVGRSYDRYEVRDPAGRIWKILRDSSIKAIVPDGSRGPEEKYKCELVTPILSYKDIPLLQRVVRVLRHAGMKVNKSCGLHVHVSAKGQTVSSLINLIRTVAAHEDLLLKALRIPSNRFYYCAKVEPTLLQRLKSSRPSDIASMRAAWYQYDDGSGSVRTHYDSSRYHGLNLHSVWCGTGIEYRFFNSTTHAGKVKAYIQLCLAMSMKATQMQRACDKPYGNSDDLIRMRQWLVNLGLTGDEFKTARLHLTSNLKATNHR